MSVDNGTAPEPETCPVSTAAYIKLRIRRIRTKKNVRDFVQDDLWKRAGQMVLVPADHEHEPVETGKNLTTLSL